MKSRNDHRQSFRLTRDGFSIRPSGRLFVAKVGPVRVRWSRELPSEPSSVTIIREPDEHYYASFVVDVTATPLPAVQREAGVDVGLTRLATIAATDGQRLDLLIPKHLGRKQRKLARLEREKSRRQKGLTNRDKTRCKVAGNPRTPSLRSTSTQQAVMLPGVVEECEHLTDHPTNPCAGDSKDIGRCLNWSTTAVR